MNKRAVPNMPCMATFFSKINSRACTAIYRHYIYRLRLALVGWGAAAQTQWLELTTDNRVVPGSNPTEANGNFGNFLYPTLPVSFGRDTKSRWSLLSLSLHGRSIMIISWRGGDSTFKRAKG